MPWIPEPNPRPTALPSESPENARKLLRTYLHIRRSFRSRYKGVPAPSDVFLCAIFESDQQHVPESLFCNTIMSNTSHPSLTDDPNLGDAAPTLLRSAQLDILLSMWRVMCAIAAFPESPSERAVLQWNHGIARELVSGRCAAFTLLIRRVSGAVYPL